MKLALGCDEAAYELKMIIKNHLQQAGHDTYSAERASRSNDAQIITIGSRVVGPELAKAIVDKFLESTFDGGKSQPKVDLISQYESQR